MSNIDAVNGLINAIHFDRFAEIEAHHAPHAVFHSFRGPTLRDAVSIADWHRDFLRDYADCNYTDIEYIESGNTVVIRATIEAKGYDWRPFTQRVVEVFEFEEGEVVARRMYAMLPDLELEKPVQQAMDNAVGYKGGTSAGSKKTTEQWFAALGSGDMETARGLTHDKSALIDGVHGAAAGFDKAAELAGSLPRPAFGAPRVTGSYFGDHTGLIEEAIEPSRPREAIWVRLVDDKVAVVETYWMLREIGVTPETKTRYMKQVILPI